MAAAGYGAAGAPSGSFMNLDNTYRGSDKGRGMSFQAQTLGFLSTPPFLLFALMLFVFSFLSGSNPTLCVILAGICIAFAVLFFSIGKGHVKGPIYTFVSILAFIGTINGIMAGSSIQARFFGNYWNYKDRPIYTDVLPTDPASARADGGIINFASNAVVDTMRSGHISSSKGRRFCVAPILDESQQARAEYWAVGMDCCEGRVGFYCDDAQDIDAKTGAVVFDIASRFTADPYAMYMDAVKQASARNGLAIPQSPVLVRWVKESSTVTDGLWREGWMHILASLAFYGIASLIIAVVLHAATSRGR